MSMVVGGFTYAFNSLFEMPPGRTADAAPTVNKAFNSLFEMLRSGKTTVLELVQSIIFQFST